MKKTHRLFLLIGTISLVSLLFYMNGFNGITGEAVLTHSNPETKVLGYCPTMENYLELLEDESFDFSGVSSAKEALSKLEEGSLDVALIGRRAYEYEYSPNEVILKEGYTLVAEEGGLIYSEDLGYLEIQTYVKDDGLEEFFPDLNLNYHETFEEAVGYGGVALVKWSDWNDDLQLVIPIHGDGRKDRRFRTPVLYSN